MLIKVMLSVTFFIVMLSHIFNVMLSVTIFIIMSVIFFIVNA